MIHKAVKGLMTMRDTVTAEKELSETIRRYFKADTDQFELVHPETDDVYFLLLLSLAYLASSPARRGDRSGGGAVVGG